jgi:hypothetical protein
MHVESVLLPTLQLGKMGKTSTLWQGRNRSSDFGCVDTAVGERTTDFLALSSFYARFLPWGSVSTALSQETNNDGYVSVSDSYCAVYVLT